jgi:hypothetical protein
MSDPLVKRWLDAGELDLPLPGSGQTAKRWRTTYPKTHCGGLLDSEVPKLLPGTTVIAAHWRHPVSDYPLDGDAANDIIGATPTLHQTAHYRDGDVVIDVFENATRTSVAVHTGVPGAGR